MDLDDAIVQSYIFLTVCYLGVYPLFLVM